MGIVTRKLRELGLDIVQGFASGLELLCPRNHGANVDRTFSSGKIQRTCLRLAE